MNPIRAVIFDMDGVLIDAKDWHYEALNRALAHFGYTISRYDHLVTFDGLPTRKKLEMLSLEQSLPAALHPLINDLKQRYTVELVHSRCKPLFQHEFALSNLKAAGYKIGVASNSVRQSVELMMEKSALRPYFDILVSNQDVKRAKPDPEIYRFAAEKLGISPQDCLVIEDNPNGIAAAEAAGAHLMIVESVTDVTWDNLQRHLAPLNAPSSSLC